MIIPTSDGVVRLDRYTIAVDGHTVRATEEQEARIRAMTAAQRTDFLRVMGVDRD